MCKIAICEDEKVQVEKICEILKKFELNEGIKLNVDTFSSGEELIENKFEKYDIVFLDIKMKKLTGIETSKIIRKSSEKIKIIFITALEQYWPEGYTVSAYRYILKPIKEDELYSIIKDLINE
ncbi:response regulator, partial [Clostridioides difficile]|nr:response regulator [Clostridioides difficile]